MKKYLVFRVKPRLGTGCSFNPYAQGTPALSPQNVLTSAQTYQSFSSSTLPMVSCKRPRSTCRRAGSGETLPGQVLRCDAKHARIAHHQKSAHSHEKYLVLGLLRGEFVVSCPAALRLLTHPAQAGVSGWQVCNTRTMGGGAAVDVPCLAARPRESRAGKGGPRAHPRCAWLVAQQPALVCRSKGVSRWVALGSRKGRRGGVLQGVSVPARAGAHRGRLHGDRRDGGVPQQLEHSFFV